MHERSGRAAAEAATAPPDDPIVVAEALTKVYGGSGTAVHALAGVSARFAPGQFTAIMGPSGSGKSTLLHCLAGLDRPTGGQVTIGGVDLTRLSPTALTVLRRERLGFVFQAFNLLPMLTVEENITLTARLGRRPVDPAWLATLTYGLGLRDRLRHRPGELSGGQQQRVAVARALLTRPDVVFADEPTGNLDSHASAEVLRFLRGAVDTYGQTVVLVTHNPIAAAHTDRVLFLSDGRIVDELPEPSTGTILARVRGLEG
jgi:putative ABC transport system ATP-binding protein